MGEAMERYNKLFSQLADARREAWDEGVEEMFAKLPGLVGFGWTASNEYDDNTHSDYVRASAEDILIAVTPELLASLPEEEQELYIDCHLSTPDEAPEDGVTASMQDEVSSFLQEFDYAWLIHDKGGYGTNWVRRENPSQVEVSD